MLKHLDCLTTHPDLEEEAEAIVLVLITVGIILCHLTITREEDIIMEIKEVTASTKTTTKIIIRMKNLVEAEAEEAEGTREEEVDISRVKCMRAIPTIRTFSRRMIVTSLQQWHHAVLILAPEPCLELQHVAHEGRISSELGLSYKVRERPSSHLEDL